MRIQPSLIDFYNELRKSPGGFRIKRILEEIANEEEISELLMDKIKQSIMLEEKREEIYNVFASTSIMTKDDYLLTQDSYNEILRKTSAIKYITVKNNDRYLTIEYDNGTISSELLAIIYIPYES